MNTLLMGETDRPLANPFELNCVADSYDLPRNRGQAGVTMLRQGRFCYPAVFGSSGGGNFLKIMERLDTIREEVATLLEAGCGVGALYEVLRMNSFVQSYTGLDYSANHIDRARRHYPEARFVLGSATALPFEADAFDFVFENNMFPFLIGIEQAIREMVRVARKYVLFQCHATPIPGGVYCFQPMFIRATTQKRNDGTFDVFLPDAIDPLLRPHRLIPGLIRPTPDGGAKLAVAKVKKVFINIDLMKAVLNSLPVEIVEEKRTPGNFPVIMTAALASRNTAETMAGYPDDSRVTDDDVLVDIKGMDAFFFLRKKA